MRLGHGDADGGGQGELSRLAQVYAVVKHTRESHQAFSETVLGYLREQDFFK